MNKDTLRQLHTAVADRLSVVADHALRDSDPSAHLQQLKAAASRLDQLVSTLPVDTDPMLRHYLERQSYLKALAWLDTASVSNAPSGDFIPSSSEN
jgi:predicted component of type VI protein secretion system